MSVAPSVTREIGADGLVLTLSGDWTVAHSAALEERADSLAEPAKPAVEAILDLSAVDRMDTAGAWAIDRARTELAGIRGRRRLSRRASRICAAPEGSRLQADRAGQADARAVRAFPPERGREFVVTAGYDLAEGVSFLGELVVMTIRLLPFPHRWRWTAMAYHLENYSLRSVPIIALINFLVGAIVTQQGIFQLNQFGAGVLRRQPGRRPGDA